MKTATIPALRVEPKLRDAVEEVLAEGETLSSFMEEALRTNIMRRQHQQAFITRGLASAAMARQNQEYYSAESVLDELQTMLDETKP